MNTVDLRVGWGCDQRCVFCDQATRRAATDTPDASTEAVISAMPKADAIWLAGGEITLRRDLPRIVAAARGARRIGLQTSGKILAAPGAAAGLRAMGVTDVAIALHAPTATIHDHLVGVAGFRKTVAGVRAAVAAGLTTRLHTVVTRSLDLPAMARLAVALGVRGHRWILAREEGPTDPRSWAPRLALVAGPLRAAIAAEWDEGIEAETVGVPLCLLDTARAAAADRRDLPDVSRHAPPGFEDAPRARSFGPPCADCALRPACPGVEAAYAARWGWDELAAPVRRPFAELSLEDDAGPRSGRALRQELVRASVDGATGVAFVGAAPWAHPELPKLLGEAARLGLRDIEVWGPADGLDGVDDLGRLAPLTRVRVPGDTDLERLRAAAPGCVIERQ